MVFDQKTMTSPPYVLNTQGVPLVLLRFLEFPSFNTLSDGLNLYV